MRHVFFALTALLAATVPALAGSSNPLYLDTVKATVMIKTPCGGGTGWIVNKAKKQIITAQHVVDRRETVEVVFPTWADNKVITDRVKYDKTAGATGRVLKSDKTRDLALIEVDELPADATELKLAATLPESGDDVHSVGCPGSSSGLWVYSYGRVRQVTTFDAQAKFSRGDVQVVETQVPINPGDSGGPLVNDKGELVGVNRSVHAGGSLISISVAMTEVKTFLAAPIPDRKADKGDVAKAKPKADDSDVKPTKPKADEGNGLGSEPEGRFARRRGLKE